MARPFPATANQQRLLCFIRGHFLAKGYAPCFREMAAGLGYPTSSKSSIACLLLGLEDRGYIRRLRARERAIELLVHPSIPSAPDGAPLYFMPAPGSHD